MKNVNVTRMVEEEEETSSFPVSPTGQYFTSSVMSISVICVLESEIPIDDSCTMTLLKDVFIPINPRFSSIMVRDKNGVKQWKKVEVKHKDHINVPIFPEGKSKEFYDNCFNEYITKISMEQLPQSKPLWEIHIFKYPTTKSAGNLVFKLHHSLGDGFSLMGALLSCLQRADNPSLPLTFPAFNNNNNNNNNNNYNNNNNPNLKSDYKKRFCTNVTQRVSGVVNTLLDFGWSLLKSTNLEDERTSIRSGDEGVEFRPIDITTMEFCLDHLKQIKSNLKVTINDVICGVLFLGVRLYMEETKYEQKNANSTALVLLNTRNIEGYKSVKEMLQPKNESKWGNQFAFLHVSLPKIDKEESSTNPLSFVFKAQDVIQRKRNSAAVILTGKLLDTLQKYRGPEVTAKYIHSTLKNSSMTISNMIGPVERMALANHPVKSLYFMVVGVPESLTITMMSYMGKLRVAVGTEKGLIDPQKFKCSIENAFDRIFKASVPSASFKSPN
ncbi:wax ester synthase/diacylglycerol acyltransferase 4-like [Solanum dulcamara]|uniref:wax ester synthase/diacylglycerol acyltransferase 4-like n=1 Tax=Solanum dulcamara TaxID=45834 RepID=UPI002486113F|nr:wax ester synthase/diacylglycerol acyltransferase 4-like [Solanum dulcamara]